MLIKLTEFNALNGLSILIGNFHLLSYNLCDYNFREMKSIASSDDLIIIQIEIVK